MTTTAPVPNGHHAPPSEGVPARQLQWLRGEIDEWRAEGLLSDTQGDAILARYHATRTFSLTRLLLGTGACFVGVGLIWLVAANLDALTPMARFLLVTALWLALLVSGEALAARGAHQLLVGAVRLVAAFAVGGVVFQAAQSLQVPAYDAGLVGVWAAATLLQAYAFRAVGPLMVGVATGVVFSLWQGLTPSPTFADVVLTTGATGVAALGLAAYDERRHPRFAATWRVAGVALVLAGLFIGALPVDDGFELSLGWWQVALWVLAAAAVAVLATVRDRRSLAEVLGGVAGTALALLLVAWEAGDSVDEVDLTSWTHTVVAVIGFVAVAIGVAVVGTLRDSRTLPAVATVALVVFTTFQSFAVFAPIVDGAWLFLVLGLVLLASGWGFDRARRRLAAAIDDDRPDPRTGSHQSEGDVR